MRRGPQMFVVVAAVLLLAGCGGGGDLGGDSKAVAASSPRALADKLGCTYEGGSEELFVKEGGPCGEYGVYVFADNEARDNYVKAAQGFGGNYLVGDRWAVSADTAALIEQAKGKVGGKVA